MSTEDVEDTTSSTTTSCRTTKDDLNTWVEFRTSLVGGRVKFNPVITLGSVLIIWGFVIWCVVAGDDIPFKDSKQWIGQQFTWFYVGSTNLWILLLCLIYFKYYSVTIIYFCTVVVPTLYIVAPSMHL